MALCVPHCPRKGLAWDAKSLVPLRPFTISLEFNFILLLYDFQIPFLLVPHTLLLSLALCYLPFFNNFCLRRFGVEPPYSSHDTFIDFLLRRKIHTGPHEHSDTSNYSQTRENRSLGNAYQKRSSSPSFVTYSKQFDSTLYHPT
jgi:hypothetical protein